jgi:carbohydrate-selective porin OprB
MLMVFRNLLVAGCLLMLAGAVFCAEDGAAPPAAEAGQGHMTVEERLTFLEKKLAGTGKVGATLASWFERIELGIRGTGVVQGTMGAERRLSDEEDVTDANVEVDLEFTAAVGEFGKGYVLLEAGSGDGVDGDVPTYWGFNGTADDNANVRLAEAWYEHRLLAESLTVRLGKIDVGGGCGRTEAAFDANAYANDECAQFLSPGFANSVVIEFPDDNGPGVLAWWSPSEMLDVGVGLADADGDWDNVGDNVFVIAELDFKPKLWGRQGNYRFYGWYNDTQHELLLDPARDGRSGHGFGVSCDQEIGGGVGLFARYGWQRGDVYPVENAWSAGLDLAGGTWKRPDDRIGVAYGMAILSDEQEKLNRAGGVDGGDEHHFELYYSIAVNEQVTITPDVQCAINPNGDAKNDVVWALGLRAGIDF